MKWNGKYTFEIRKKLYVFVKKWEKTSFPRIERNTMIAQK